MMIKILLLLIWLFILPTVVGCLWTRKTPEYSGNLLASYFYGLFTMFAWFEVLAVPMVFLKCSLTLLCRVWSGGVLLLAILSIVKNRSFRKQRIWLKGLKKKMTPVLLVVLACALLQTGYVTERQHIDEDDAFYLASATTAAATDSLYRYSAYTGKKYKSLPARYVLAGWPLYLAAMSRLTFWHPAVLAHTILAGIVVLWAYLVYALLAAALFPGEKRKQAVFLLFVAVLLSFSGYSRFSAATFLFIRGWQGKAVLAGVGIPALFYSCWMAMKEKGGWLTWLMLSAVVTGCFMFTTMGVAASLLVVGCCALAAAVLKKNWRYLVNSGLACLPALVCGIFYAYLK